MQTKSKTYNCHCREKRYDHGVRKGSITNFTLAHQGGGVADGMCRCGNTLAYVCVCMHAYVCACTYNCVYTPACIDICVCMYM